jgi:2-hydroxy-3-keto-5-methylthiopentenyl-1-phosphate phosphatase
LGPDAAQEKTPLKGQIMSGQDDKAPPRMRRDVAVLCDFDGTIVPCDTVDLIYRNFAQPPCAQLNLQWIRGEISTRQELEGCFATIKASRAEMESALVGIPIDSAFTAFLGFCGQRGYRFAILSDGVDWIINFILERHGIDGLTVYSNELRFEADGLRVSFPFFDPESPLRGVSKPAIIRRHQAEGFKVVFVGDGLTDIEAVEVADIVYARDKLLQYCRERGIEAVAFSGFADLMAKWPDL